MTFDKFGTGALLLGLLLMLGVLHFAFMVPAGGWGVTGLINAVVAVVEGGLILFGLLLMIIGILLLVL